MRVRAIALSMVSRRI